MIDDAELLSRYSKGGSDDAFRELVDRHLDLVYSAACRQVGGDTHRAQDVAQLVFADLARKASSLSRHTALAGWLYTSTHFTAAKLRRTEQRRQAREQEAHAMHELLSSPAGDTDWKQLRPVLDAAMHELNRGDRDAVLLRFFEKRSFGEVGRHLGLGENAARMKVERALEKLGGLLAKHGVTSTAGALSLVLTNQAVAAAPGGMAAAVASGALTKATIGVGGAGLVATTVQLMSTTKFTISAASVAGLLAISTTLFYAGQTARAEVTLASANHEADALRARLGRINGRIATLEGAEAANAVALASRPGGPAVDTNVKETSSDKAIHTLMNDPTVLRLMVRSEKNQESRRFGPFYRQMGFSAAQIEQFEARLETALTDSYRAQGGMEVKGGELHVPVQVDEKLHEIRAGFEKDLRGIFGEQALQGFLDHERLEAAADVAAQVAGKVFFTDTPLTAAQSAELTRIIAANSAQYAAGGAVDRVLVDWDKILADSATVLSPAQFAALQAHRTWVDFRAKRDAAIEREKTGVTP